MSENQLREALEAIVTIPTEETLLLNAEARAMYVIAVRALEAGKSVTPLPAPGMTDLMVTPESIDDVFLESERWDCLSCQTMNRAGATFCSNCGEPRGWISYR